MSKSVLLKSSLAKKYWMALTGLFLCTFLVGHLLGNLQLFAGGEEGKRAFNEYGYFMTHNLFIKVLSYLTYFSILFHAIDGFLLAYQNAKARPTKYAYNRPQTNSRWASRNMAMLGSLILIFIVMHMANFWWKMKLSSTEMPLHKITKEIQMPQETPYGVQNIAMKVDYYLTTKGTYIPKDHPLATGIPGGSEIVTSISKIEGTHFYDDKGIMLGEGYKDLHSCVMAFFGHSADDFPTNPYALIAVIFYVFAMIGLIFHLMHGFSSAFQSLGVRHPKYTPIINGVGRFCAVVIPLAFASIPIYLFMTK